MNQLNIIKLNNKIKDQQVAIDKILKRLNIIDTRLNNIENELVDVNAELANHEARLVAGGL